MASFVEEYLLNPIGSATRYIGSKIRAGAAYIGRKISSGVRWIGSKFRGLFGRPSAPAVSVDEEVTLLESRPQPGVRTIARPKRYGPVPLNPGERQAIAKLGESLAKMDQSHYGTEQLAGMVQRRAKMALKPDARYQALESAMAMNRPIPAATRKRLKIPE